jgi:hypothetical protein
MVGAVNHRWNTVGCSDEGRIIPSFQPTVVTTATTPTTAITDPTHGQVETHIIIIRKSNLARRLLPNWPWGCAHLGQLGPFARWFGNRTWLTSPIPFIIIREFEHGYTQWYNQDQVMLRGFHGVIDY